MTDKDKIADALLQLSRSIVEAAEMIATAIQEDAVERDRLAPERGKV